MATFNIYKLHFTSPLHIGYKREDMGISQKTISSDSMYAALTASLAKMGTKIPEDGNLGFVISSLFPFYQATDSATATYFFPKPMYQSLPKLKDLSDAKKVKKVEWLEKSFFEGSLNGAELFDNAEGNVECIQGKFLTKDAIDKDFIYSQVFPRVTISRTGEEDAVPYYIDRLFFKGKSGLFFIAEGDTTLLDKAMNLLQLEGIGTDRNVGNGYFKYEKESIILNLPMKSEYAMSLSTFFPPNKDCFTTMIQGNKASYDLERRGGWITTFPYNTIRKNAIYGFTPGSVFSMNIGNAVTMGKIVDLRPEGIAIPHPIWRSGKAIFLPINI